jgi:hypothetical protein
MDVFKKTAIYAEALRVYSRGLPQYLGEIPSKHLQHKALDTYITFIRGFTAMAFCENR